MNRISHIIKTSGPAGTEVLAAKLAGNLKGGELIELISDLGGGKTTFTRGLASGLGTKDAVASPTFTISREYGGGRLHVYHFDFYRLGEAGIIADELAEIIHDKKAVIVVEWAEIVRNVLPDERLRIKLKVIDENDREIEFQYPESMHYLLEGLE
jgi:tRNA threonylcarbamoyladenosine biosynthesis protein TsaE